MHKAELIETHALPYYNDVRLFLPWQKRFSQEKVLIYILAYKNPVFRDERRDFLLSGNPAIF